jgi:hypothetical protein
VADLVVITGVKPYDGRYPLDFDHFTSRELGWIKRYSGYLPLSFVDGLRGADADLLITLGMIALHRAGKLSPQDAPDFYERCVDVEFGSITIELEQTADAEDADAGPPAGSSNGSSSSPSPVSSESSETSRPDPKPGGPLPWDTLERAPATSET